MELDRWQASADAWIEHVDTGDDLRESTLDPIMIRHVIAAHPARLVDLGCGEGRFCRMLRKRGYSPLGLEITPKLVAAAKKRDSTGDYARASALAIPLANGSIDVVVTYIVLIDIEQHDIVAREVTRILKPGGKWIDAHVCPFRTASDTPWIRGSKGERLHVPVEQYARERPIRAAWKGIDVVNYHRSLSGYWAPFLDARLRLVAFEEPTPSPELALHDGDLRVPLGMVSVWEKE